MEENDCIFVDRRVNFFQSFGGINTNSETQTYTYLLTKRTKYLKPKHHVWTKLYAWKLMRTPPGASNHNNSSFQSGLETDSFKTQPDREVRYSNSTMVWCDSGGLKEETRSTHHWVIKSEEQENIGSVPGNNQAVQEELWKKKGRTEVFSTEGQNPSQFLPGK